LCASETARASDKLAAKLIAQLLQTHNEVDHIGKLGVENAAVLNFSERDYATADYI
jgi:hypothetical protein